MRIEIEEPGRSARKASLSLFFSAGFRPFFLLAGVAAAVNMLGWLVVYFAHGDIPQAFAPVVWHGHEMIYGFAAAAVAGFLLTAVPNWTSSTPVAGKPLMLLTAIWLLGRLTFWLSGVCPAWVVAVADLAFLPVMGYLVARPLIAAGKMRNIVFLPILGVLWIGALLVQLENLAGTATGLMGVRLGIWVLLLMIAIIGGRIIPAFTGAFLRMQGLGEVRTISWLEQVAPPAVVAAAIADVFIPDNPLTGVLLLIAAVLHGWRLSGWQGVKTRHSPILWVLHLGYGWLVIGLALRGISVFVPDVVPPSAALHALTAGTIATMILGVTTRAALGHSGRPLKVAPSIAWAYGLLTAGAFVRSIGPIVHPSAAGDLIPAVAGLLWLLAFGIYVAVYLPVCTQPRADGRPG